RELQRGAPTRARRGHPYEVSLLLSLSTSQPLLQEQYPHRRRAGLQLSPYSHLHRLSKVEQLYAHNLVGIRGVGDRHDVLGEEQVHPAAAERRHVVVAEQRF